MCIRAGGVVRRPRPTDGVTSAGSIAAVVGGRTPSCFSPIIFCYCSPPVPRSATPVPVLIHIRIVVHLPRSTGGRAPAGRIVTIAGVQLSSCRAPIDTFRFNPLVHTLFPPSPYASMPGWSSVAHVPSTGALPLVVLQLESATLHLHAAHQSVPDAVALLSKGLALSFPYLSMPK